MNGYSNRSVTLVNNSKKKIEISFNVANQLEELKKNFISVVPSDKISINPREKVNV